MASSRVANSERVANLLRRWNRCWRLIRRGAADRWRDPGGAGAQAGSRGRRSALRPISTARRVPPALPQGWPDLPTGMTTDDSAASRSAHDVARILDDPPTTSPPARPDPRRGRVARARAHQAHHHRTSMPTLSSPPAESRQGPPGLAGCGLGACGCRDGGRLGVAASARRLERRPRRAGADHVPQTRSAASRSAGPA